MTETKNDPYLDEGMRGYIFKTAKKNLYRIAGYELEDLVQEGYACYYKCRMRYVGRPPAPNHTALPFTNPTKLERRHFMSIVKTAFHNSISTLATKCPSGVEFVVSDLVPPDRLQEEYWDSVIPLAGEEVSVYMLIQTAPREIKQLLQLLVVDAVSLSYERFGKWHRKRETNNQRYCRLLGLPQDYDLAGALERHFLR